MTAIMHTDEHERELALDPHQSFIVQAPAGSGKTELLIQRFLTLLNHVKTPEEILAITFTKRAANEMRTRVINALKRAACESTCEQNKVNVNLNASAKKTSQIALQVLRRDQAFGWNLLLNPNRLHIQTIDSLCVYLTKSLPLLSRFGSQPNISALPQNLYRETIQTVLTHLEDEHVAWSQDIATLLLHLDNNVNQLHGLLIDLITKRDQWMQYIHLDLSNDAIKVELERHLGLVIYDRLTELAQSIPHSERKELLAILRFAAAHCDKTESQIAAFANLNALPMTTPDNLAIWQSMAGFLLTKDYSWRKRVDKNMGFPALNTLKNTIEKTTHTAYRERFTNLIIALSEHEDLYTLLKEILQLPAPFYHQDQWSILRSLFQILKLVAAQLRLVFQQHGQIDFIENAQAALTALGDDEKPTDLMLTLDYTIQHILIDEFQDTSSTQFNLLEKLILGWEPDDGRTLFVVGDPMQSIYRFREAEVGLFIRMRTQGISKVNLIPLTLSANFRSENHIVDWNNRHFQHIFPRHDDVATGAVSFSKSVAKNSNLSNNKDNSTIGKVSIEGFLTTEDHHQANAILAVIQNKQIHSPNEKIAILVRSRSHLSAIIPALKKANITFQAVDIDPLGARTHIQDLLSLTCGLLHLADRIAWLAILRAPWCGLRLNDLLIIAGANPHLSIWEQLLNAELIAKLSEDGQRRATNLISILKTQLNEKNRIDLRAWIETTWRLLGGPATLAHEAEIHDAQAYFDLLTILEEDNLNLNIDILKEKVSTFYASTHQIGDCHLQIMTIHSAKGLEFDTVILPHLESMVPKDDKTLLNWLERPLSNDKTALLIAPLNPRDEEKDLLYEYIHRQKIIKSEYEADRLFYVATTRAKKSLYLFYNLEIDDDGKAKIAPNTFLKKIWPFIAQDELKRLEQVKSCEDSNDSATNENMIKLQPLQHHHTIKRLSSTWQNIMELPSQKLFYHQQQSGFMLMNNVAKIIGVIVHLALQNIAKYSLAWWQKRNPNQQHLYLTQQLTHAGVLASNLTEAIQISHRMIENCIHDVRGKWILHDHLDAHSEYAISTIIDNEIKNFIIDRTFVDDENVRWIIDFKTSTFTTGQLDTFLESEYEKYKGKMQSYYQAFQQKQENRAIHLGLYFPAIPAWKAWAPEK